MVILILVGKFQTIIALLNLLNVFDGIRPPFSSVVIVELRKKDENHLVKVNIKTVSYTHLTLPTIYSV